MFEVTKAEEEEKSTTSPPASPSAGNNASGQTHPPNSKASALRVTIPSELQGVAYIEVLCKKGQCVYIYMFIRIFLYIISLMLQILFNLLL